MNTAELLKKYMPWNLVWIASYPKSGNTWFRIFMANYLQNANEPVNINHLSRYIEIMEAGKVATIRQFYGINVSDLDFEEVDQCRSALYTHWKNQEKHMLLKTHDAYTYLSNNQPLLGDPIHQAAIYIIRNPLDIAVSYAHHFISSHNEIKNLNNSIAKINSEDHTLCDDATRFSFRVRRKLLSWSQHVISWQKATLPTLIIRYEDMLLDTFNTFSKAIRFLGLPDEPKRIQRAIHFSSFAILQQQEETSGYKEKNPRAKSFFRLGKSGGYREQLTEQQIQLIIKIHENVMRQFSYLENKN